MAADRSKSFNGFESMTSRSCEGTNVYQHSG